MAQPRSHNWIIRAPANPNSHVRRTCTLPLDQGSSLSVSVTVGSRFVSTPMSPLTPERVARALLQNFKSQYDVVGLDAIPSARIQQLYSVRVADGRSLILTLPPPTDVRPMRCERECIYSEAVLLNWLTSLPPHSAQRGSSKGDGESTPSGYDEPKQNGNGSMELSQAVNHLQGYLPELIDYCHPRPESRTPALLLSKPTLGTAVSSLPQTLSSKGKKSVEWQAGQLFRRISCHVSPSGKFGYAIDILRGHGATQSLMSRERPATPPPEANMSGFDTWSQAFHILLESVLRDLEDSLVQVGYARVRYHFERLKHLLDKVHRPSLVSLEALEDTNILVTIPESRSHSVSTQKGAASVKITVTNGGKAASGEEDAISVTGLRDWSNCLFGDPLIATTFNESPSKNFLHGLETPVCEGDPFTTVPLIEDREHVAARVLLYEAYHCLCGIAKEYRRPRNVEFDMELEWRRRLQKAMGKLDTLDDTGTPLPIRPAAEAGSPPKRVKLERDGQ